MSRALSTRWDLPDGLRFEPLLPVLLLDLSGVTYRVMLIVTVMVSDARHGSWQSQLQGAISDLPQEDSTKAARALYKARIHARTLDRRFRPSCVNPAYDY